MMIEPHYAPIQRSTLSLTASMDLVTNELRASSVFLPSKVELNML